MAFKLMILLGTLLCNALSGNGKHRENGANSTDQIACPRSFRALHSSTASSNFNQPPNHPVTNFRALLPLETWQAVQERVNGATRAPVRKDINADFPLRGIVLCNDCGNPLTANWSKSKTGKKHSYYLCFTKGCESHRKSIRRDVLEEAFTGYLRALQPSETLLTLTKAMFKNIWDQRAEQAQLGMVSLKREVSKIEKQIDGLLDRIVDASLPSVVSAYEKRLAKLEQEKLITQEKLAKGAQPTHSFDQLFELACAFLASPWKLWESGQFTLQRTVLKLAFAERKAYCRQTGLRTPQTTLPFKVLAGVRGQKCEMAEGTGPGSEVLHI